MQGERGTLGIHRALTQDWLIQWDHGAPGVSAALLAGWRAFGEQRYRAAAEKALDCTWRRGLVLKGLMNCHGIGGNTWSAAAASRTRPCPPAHRLRGHTFPASAVQLYAASVTSDAKYLYRALSFQQTVLDHALLSDLDTMRVPQPLPEGPWQFWTGSIESAIELWTDLLYRGPAKVSFTGWAAAL